MNGQAKAGGEIGLNGEFYEGGQFLPSSETTVKGAQKPFISKGKKFEIAPYVWEAAPADDMLSIYDRINHACSDNRRTCEFVKGQGFIGFRFVSVFESKTGTRYDYKTDTWNQEPYPQEWIEFITGLMNKYNNGERWFLLADDPYHFRNQN